MDPTDDLMLAPDASDPNAFLENMLALAHSTMASKSPAAGIPQPRVLTPPKGLPPTAPLPTPSPDQPSADTGSGTDWRGLLQLIAPAIGSLVAGGGNQMPAFWNAYLGRQAEMQQDTERKKTQQQNTKKAAAEFLLNTEQDAEKYDDPVALAQHLQAADEAGALAFPGIIKPGDLKNKYTVSPNKLAQKKLDELNALLDGAEKGGYSLDDLASSGAVLTTKDGKQVPVSTALDLTRKRPLDANGKPIAKPAKVGGTEEERFIAARAKAWGYGSIDQVDPDTELQWRRDFREAGRADKVPASGGVDAQFNDLLELWKQQHPGQDPPADVRMKLRTQANKVNDKEPTGLGAGGNSALDPDGIEYAATEFRVTGKMPPLGMSNGPARAAIINRAAAQAKALGQTPAAAIQKQAAYTADANALKKMRTMASAAEAFETKADAQADIIRDLSQKVDRTQWPIINQAIIAGKIDILGDKNAQLLANAIQTFSAEYAKLIEGSTGSAAGSSDSARRASEKLISAKLNKGTVESTLTLMQREMSLTRDGYNVTIDHITGRMGGQPTTPPPTTPTPTAGAPGLTYQDYLKAKGAK
jgi:hypothetical protein